MVLAAVVIVAMFNIFHSQRQGVSKVRHHFIQIGDEREELWIPGDPLHENDYDEFDD